jgi:hypothetical protein
MLTWLLMIAELYMLDKSYITGLIILASGLCLAFLFITTFISDILF